MDFIVKLLFLSGKYITQIAGRTIIEIFNRGLKLPRQIALKYEQASEVVQPYDNMLELINSHVHGMNYNEEVQLAYLTDVKLGIEDDLNKIPKTLETLDEISCWDKYVIEYLNNSAAPNYLTNSHEKYIEPNSLGVDVLDLKFDTGAANNRDVKFDEFYENYSTKEHEEIYSDEYRHLYNDLPGTHCHKECSAPSTISKCFKYNSDPLTLHSIPVTEEIEKHKLKKSTPENKPDSVMQPAYKITDLSKERQCVDKNKDDLDNNNAPLIKSPLHELLVSKTGKAVNEPKNIDTASESDESLIYDYLNEETEARPDTKLLDHNKKDNKSERLDQTENKKEPFQAVKHIKSKTNVNAFVINKLLNTSEDKSGIKNYFNINTQMSPLYSCYKDIYMKYLVTESGADSYYKINAGRFENPKIIFKKTDYKYQERPLSGKRCMHTSNKESDYYGKVINSEEALQFHNAAIIANLEKQVALKLRMLNKNDEHFKLFEERLQERLQKNKLAQTNIDFRNNNYLNNFDLNLDRKLKNRIDKINNKRKLSSVTCNLYCKNDSFKELVKSQIEENRRLLIINEKAFKIVERNVTRKLIKDKISNVNKLRYKEILSKGETETQHLTESDKKDILESTKLLNINRNVFNNLENNLSKVVILEKNPPTTKAKQKSDKIQTDVLNNFRYRLTLGDLNNNVLYAIKHKIRNILNKNNIAVEQQKPKTEIQEIKNKVFKLHNETPYKMKDQLTQADKNDIIERTNILEKNAKVFESFEKNVNMLISVKSKCNLTNSNSKTNVSTVKTKKSRSVTNILESKNTISNKTASLSEIFKVASKDEVKVKSKERLELPPKDDLKTSIADTLKELLDKPMPQGISDIEIGKNSIIINKPNSTKYTINSMVTPLSNIRINEDKKRIRDIKLNIKYHQTKIANKNKQNYNTKPASPKENRQKEVKRTYTTQGKGSDNIITTNKDGKKINIDKFKKITTFEEKVKTDSAENLLKIENANLKNNETVGKKENVPKEIKGNLNSADLKMMGDKDRRSHLMDETETPENITLRFNKKDQTVSSNEFQLEIESGSVEKSTEKHCPNQQVYGSCEKSQNTNENKSKLLKINNKDINVEIYNTGKSTEVVCKINKNSECNVSTTFTSKNNQDQCKPIFQKNVPNRKESELTQSLRLPNVNKPKEEIQDASTKNTDVSYLIPSAMKPILRNSNILVDKKNLKESNMNSETDIPKTEPISQTNKVFESKHSKYVSPMNKDTPAINSESVQTLGCINVRKDEPTTQRPTENNKLDKSNKTSDFIPTCSLTTANVRNKLFSEKLETIKKEDSKDKVVKESYIDSKIKTVADVTSDKIDIKRVNLQLQSSKKHHEYGNSNKQQLNITTPLNDTISHVQNQFTFVPFNQTTNYNEKRIQDKATTENANSETKRQSSDVTNTKSLPEKLVPSTPAKILNYKQDEKKSMSNIKTEKDIDDKNADQLNKKPNFPTSYDINTQKKLTNVIAKPLVNISKGSETEKVDMSKTNVTTKPSVNISKSGETENVDMSKTNVITKPSVNISKSGETEKVDMSKTKKEQTIKCNAEADLDTNISNTANKLTDISKSKVEAINKLSFDDFSNKPNSGETEKVDMSKTKKEQTIKCNAEADLDTNISNTADKLTDISKSKVEAINKLSFDDFSNKPKSGETEKVDMSKTKKEQTIKCNAEADLDTNISNTANKLTDISKSKVEAINKQSFDDFSNKPNSNKKYAEQERESTKYEERTKFKTAASCGKDTTNQLVGDTASKYEENKERDFKKVERKGENIDMKGVAEKSRNEQFFDKVTHNVQEKKGIENRCLNIKSSCDTSQQRKNIQKSEDAQNFVGKNNYVFTESDLKKVENIDVNRVVEKSQNKQFFDKVTHNTQEDKGIEKLEAKQCLNIKSSCDTSQQHKNIQKSEDSQSFVGKNNCVFTENDIKKVERKGESIDVNGVAEKSQNKQFFDKLTHNTQEEKDKEKLETKQCFNIKGSCDTSQQYKNIQKSEDVQSFVGKSSFDVMQQYTKAADKSENVQIPEQKVSFDKLQQYKSEKLTILKKRENSDNTKQYMVRQKSENLQIIDRKTSFDKSQQCKESKSENIKVEKRENSDNTQQCMVRQKSENLQTIDRKPRFDKPQRCKESKSENLSRFERNVSFDESKLCKKSEKPERKHLERKSSCIEVQQYKDLQKPERTQINNRNASFEKLQQYKTMKKFGAAQSLDTKLRFDKSQQDIDKSKKMQSFHLKTSYDKAPQFKNVPKLRNIQINDRSVSSDKSQESKVAQKSENVECFERKASLDNVQQNVDADKSKTEQLEERKETPGKENNDIRKSEKAKSRSIQSFSRKPGFDTSQQYKIQRKSESMPRFERKASFDNVQHYKVDKSKKVELSSGKDVSEQCLKYRDAEISAKKKCLDKEASTNAEKSAKLQYFDKNICDNSDQDKDTKIPESNQVLNTKASSGTVRQPTGTEKSKNVEHFNRKADKKPCADKPEREQKLDTKPTVDKVEQFKNTPKSVNMQLSNTKVSSSDEAQLSEGIEKPPNVELLDRTTSSDIDKNIEKPENLQRFDKKTSLDITEQNKNAHKSEKVEPFNTTGSVDKIQQHKVAQKAGNVPLCNKKSTSDKVQENTDTDKVKNLQPFNRKSSVDKSQQLKETSSCDNKQQKKLVETGNLKIGQDKGDAQSGYMELSNKNDESEQISQYEVKNSIEDCSDKDTTDKKYIQKDDFNDIIISDKLNEEFYALNDNRKKNDLFKKVVSFTKIQQSSNTHSSENIEDEPDSVVDESNTQFELSVDSTQENPENSLNKDVIIRAYRSISKIRSFLQPPTKSVNFVLHTNNEKDVIESKSISPQILNFEGKSAGSHKSSTKKQVNVRCASVPRIFSNNANKLNPTEVRNIIKKESQSPNKADAGSADITNNQFANSATYQSVRTSKSLQSTKEKLQILEQHLDTSSIKHIKIKNSDTSIVQNKAEETKETKNNNENSIYDRFPLLRKPKSPDDSTKLAVNTAAVDNTTKTAGQEAKLETRTVGNKSQKNQLIFKDRENRFSKKNKGFYNLGTQKSISSITLNNKFLTSKSSSALDPKRKCMQSTAGTESTNSVYSPKIPTTKSSGSLNRKIKCQLKAEYIENPQTSPYTLMDRTQRNPMGRRKSSGDIHHKTVNQSIYDRFPFLKKKPVFTLPDGYESKSDGVEKEPEQDESILDKNNRVSYGKSVLNYRPSPIKQKNRSSNLIPTGTIWNTRLQEPVKIKISAVEDEQKPKKYRLETKEICTSLGKQIQVTYLVEHN